ncbi:hypothetical protein GCM10010988_05800 [Cnuibacter physcomitrellae]|uniref:Uncharacterized protein n=1 Tax=Cnuibacter physcomitrellae TaxID=1619308 RepID=A0A1X9LNG1_9MICO|nr:hypothetical protein B5808_09835 [Cnuibacter physcomitrellae]GGI35807.1 hypothetical protein GCM10010988_05800 [Cnuibacter physcomitrellae]
MPTGWVGSTRRSDLPKDWPKIRAQRLMIDGHRCQHIRVDTDRLCNARATDVDHIGDRDDHRVEMLRSKCRYHHQQKDSRLAGEASGRARRAARDAAKPTHPGLLSPALKQSHDRHSRGHE